MNSHTSNDGFWMDMKFADVVNLEEVLVHIRSLKT